MSDKYSRVLTMFCFRKPETPNKATGDLGGVVIALMSLRKYP